MEDDEFVSARSWSITDEQKSPSHDGLSLSYVTTGDKDMDDDAVVLKEMYTQKLDNNEQQDFHGLFKDHKIDNDELLRKIKEHSNQVGINLPTVEIRFENLTVEAQCLVGNRALPNLQNAAWNIAESALSLLGIGFAQKTKLNILKDVTGIIKPSRMALLLGPPSSGKTTLLLALAGKLDNCLKVTGEITYNGHTLDEFVPQKTSAYISQHDVHDGQLTIQESLDFSARFQGVGSKYEPLIELLRKEIEAGIISDSEADLFMKQTASQGVQSSLITDYTLKILGLDICRDAMIGDEMQGVISGGQKRRLTTGEIIVGPTKTLFMDEISTGVDCSTTFGIVKCMQQKAHITQATILMSLLQPDPDTFNLFDDVILLLEGQIVYQGPREHILHFFESCGFKCPERKGVADFLHEVTSRMDQEQYWADRSRPYKYITVSDFATQFKKFHVGLGIENELSIPYDKAQSHRLALVFKRYLVSKKELLKTSFSKELLLMKRNFVIHLLMIVKVVFLAIITASVFFRSRMYTLDEGNGALYIGALSLGLLTNLFNAFGELARIMQRLPVFYKHRDLLFHPPWTFTLSTFLLSIPISALESIVWVVVSYYTTGFAPEASRFFKQMLLIFLIQQTAAGIFRLVAGVCKTNLVANTGGCLALFLILLFGFIIPRDQFPNWLEWAYWVTPISYAFSSLAVNEMFSPRWMNKLASDNSTTLGVAVLKNFDVNADPNLVWICAAALFGFVLLLNILFTFTLMHLNPHKKQHTIILKGPENVETPGLDTTCSSHKARATNGAHKRGMVLPFTPLAMSFDSISYSVDMPPNMREKGKNGDKLQLLKEVSGTFRPGVLTALMGVSGAGKTTLLDVLSGRKTSGYIEGEVRISGFPKKQETFARICGYCEQNDIHSPHVTVHESIIYSAFLRLPKDVNREEKMKFAEEVMKVVELENVKNAMVGVAGGVMGLSTEERKRVTIAVELVANPSIIFMDEPTTGVDARAAAIVMRAVRNTVDTGRTVVCAIHRPSIHIFESFDDVILLKSGGQVMYAGPVGRNSLQIIQYFEEIPGVPKIKKNCNPATWMLEVTSAAAEHRLEVDFAQRYESSTLYQRNKSLVKELSTPPPDIQDLHFTTPYSASLWKQLQICVWKQFLCYWRNPDYNIVRCLFALFCAFVTGMPFLKFDAKRERIEALMTSIGALYNSFLFVAVNNCSSVQPMVAIERRVFYREKSARFYSALPYALAQVLVEIPYVLLQTTYYTLILYFMMGFEWIPSKFMWFFFFHLFTFLYFTYYGMMIASITPNDQIASIVSGVSYLIFNLFSGFGIPKPKIPKWWVWSYYMCPVAWTVYGIVTSQFSDIQDPINMKGNAGDPTIKWYVLHHFGFDSHFLGSAALILVGFTLFFAFIYAFCFTTLNFQRR